MTAVSAHEGKTLYVLVIDGGEHYWLSTLETSRAKCWAYARKYTKAQGDRKAQDKELREEGWRCVAVRLQVAD